jgi:hypothetical protein
MNLDRYQLKISENSVSFEFVSIGRKGRIPKIVRFSPTIYENVFDLACGNKHPETGKIDDLAVSNNGDREKILATVAATIYFFTDKYPEAWIQATGSTNSRNRLYNMKISRYLEIVQKDFYILG